MVNVDMNTTTTTKLK